MIKLRKFLILSLTKKTNKNMKIFNFKKIGGFSLSLAIIFSFHSALAQENSIPENLAPLAQELGCQTKEECAKAFDSNFEKGLELAEKYKVYDKEQSEIAASYKQEVISKLSGLTEENFEEGIIKIAKDILSKPKAAKSLQLDKGAVAAAETIVKEIKDAGTDVDVCSRPADALSRGELISCLEASKKLAKKGNILEKYVPKGIIEKSEMAEMAADLDESLSRGEYPELGKTAEEAGQKCLKTGSESLKSCDEIAQKFFGPGGVKELAAARAQTKQAGDFYLKGLEKMELITPDGRKISGKTAIKESCEKAFETKDIKLAKACGEFAVRNGFTTKEEMDQSFKIFESVAGKNINFDQCRINPEACKEFIPEERRKEFDGNNKIYEIMKAEAGFDPLQCEKSFADFEIGRKCFEASKKALPKLKEIAKDYPEAQKMISEIEYGIKRESEQDKRQKEFLTVFQNQGGPGGCGSEKECFAYCNDSAHGAECISFGAKHKVFEGNEAVERYQRYNDILANPSNYNQTGQYGDNGFNQGWQNTNRQAYPYPAGDNRGAYVNQGGFSGQVGPSPECFAAIQSGDFAKAKEICIIPANPYQYNQPYLNYQQSSAPVNRICPAIPEYNCPSSYQKIYRTTPDGCGFSECVPFSNSSYPSYDEKEKCYKSGGFWTGSYCKVEGTSGGSSSYSYSYPGCDQLTQYYKKSSNNCAPKSNCYDASNPDYNSSECQGVRTSGNYSSYSYSSYGYTGSCPSSVTNILGSGCHYMYNNSSGNSVYCNGEMTKSAKAGDTATTEGCSLSGNYSSYSYSSYSYSSYNYVPPSGQKEQVWNSYGLKSRIRTDAISSRIENLKQVCANVTSAGGNIWLAGAGDYNSQDFGMPDEAKCRSWTPGSQSSYSYSSYPSYSSCTNEMVSLLGSGCHFMYNDSSNTAVYCNGEMTKSAKLGDSAAKDGCQSGGNYSSYSYPSSYYSSYSYSSYSSSSSCPTNLLGSGCHDMSNAYFNGSMDQYVIYGGSVAKSCSAEYINGCTTGGSYSSYSYSSYSPASSASAYSSAATDPSAACSQAGGTWDGSTCVMPSTTLNSIGSSLLASLEEALKGILRIFSR